ncbi:ricin-type beta-trefoil lectin domain protein [Streptomyces lasalocidi]
MNLATGRCLDIRDGDPEQGNDVVTAPCSDSPTQRWRVDTGLGVLRSAADDSFCLDSRGATDRGVGVWTCDSVYGRNGDNLRFTVTPDGTIRPAIAPDTVVTPTAATTSPWTRWTGATSSAGGRGPPELRGRRGPFRPPAPPAATPR